tara:strand:- start:2556 stop:2810 length:255 start_codon:yes stop_codon:yes gene_type:complete
MRLQPKKNINDAFLILIKEINDFVHYCVHNYKNNEKLHVGVLKIKKKGKTFIYSNCHTLSIDGEAQALIIKSYIKGSNKINYSI